ncbi:hypothetical protein ABID26_004494 [Mesorhizobium shonense]|uniref:Winged helix-turn-helix domain-containing protein n=2 Tax=Mesorhizobium shonense TaxID=1209948 RepID=A0ABV2HYB5_9HYPH
MGTLPDRQLTLLRQIAQGQGPIAQVRLASTSWWHGAVTRDMNALCSAKMIRMWRDAARNQHMEISDAGWNILRSRQA